MPTLLWAQVDLSPLGDRTAAAWDRLVEFVGTRGLDLGLRLLAAAAIFVVGRWISQKLATLVRTLLERGQTDAALTGFLCNLAYAGLLGLTVITALGQLGIDTTSLAAIVAAAGLAIGLALQGSLSNLAAGVILVFFRPFKAGDFVEAAGTAGIVESMQIFNTRLRTLDNRVVTVPNSAVLAGVIVNFTARPTRRIDLVVGCGYEDDLRAVKQFLRDLLAADPRVLADPPPVIGVDALGDSSVNFIVRPWVATESYLDVKCDLLEKIKLGFDERGFHIPFPQRDVHLRPAANAKDLPP